MANKQTLPGIKEVQGSYVNTNGNPLIPQSNWKSPLRQLSQIGEQGVALAKQYQDIKFDGYQAQYSIMANQMYHEMQDATDPTQIDEIQAKYEQKFSQPLEDNIWGKSYLTSQYRKQWENTMKDNTLKIRLAMQHKFNNIELEKTLNSMAMAAASTGDINAMESYFNSSIALIDSKESSIEEKNVLKKNSAANFINYSFNANPNILNSFAQKYAAQLAPYGIDPNEINKKTEAYNKQKENENYIKEQRAKKEKDEKIKDFSATKQLDFLKTRNLEDADAAIKELAKLDPEEALKLHKLVYPTKEDTPKTRFINNLADDILDYQNNPTPEKLSIINDKMAEGLARNYITKAYMENNYKTMGVPTKEDQDFILAAQTTPPNKVDEYILAHPDMKSSQVTAFRNAVNEYSGFNGRQKLIIEKKGLIPNDEIISWRDSYGLTEGQISQLLDKAQTERTNNGYGSTESESVLQDLEVGNVTNNTKQAYLKLPEKEKKEVRTKANEILSKKKDLYGKELRLEAFNGNLSEEDVAENYAKDRIEKDDADDLLEIIKDNKGKNIHTISSKIISNILSAVNGEPVYDTQGALNKDLEKLYKKYDYTNVKEYNTFVDFATDLYTKVNSEFKANVKTVIDQIDDAIVSKNPQFDLDTETRRRLEIFKNTIAKQMTAEYLKGPLAGNATEIAKKYDIVNILPLWNNFAPSKKDIRNSIRKTTSTISTTNNLEEAKERLNEIYVVEEGEPNEGENKDNGNKDGNSLTIFFQKQLDNIKEFLNVEKDEEMELSLTNQGSK